MSTKSWRFGITPPKVTRVIQLDPTLDDLGSGLCLSRATNQKGSSIQVSVLWNNRKKGIYKTNFEVDIVQNDNRQTKAFKIFPK